MQDVWVERNREEVEGGSWVGDLWHGAATSRKTLGLFFAIFCFAVTVLLVEWEGKVEGSLAQAPFTS